MNPIIFFTPTAEIFLILKDEKHPTDSQRTNQKEGQIIGHKNKCKTRTSQENVTIKKHTFFPEQPQQLEILSFY